MAEGDLGSGGRGAGLPPQRGRLSKSPRLELLLAVRLHPFVHSAYIY